jgi:hypothetical protein
MQLHEGAGGSEFTLQADVTVHLPLIGGRIEEIVVEQVRNLMAAETEFTREWLRSRTG